MRYNELQHSHPQHKDDSPARSDWRVVTAVYIVIGLAIYGTASLAYKLLS